MTRPKYRDHISAGITFVSNRGGNRRNVINRYTMKAIARTASTIEVEGEGGIRYFIDTRDEVVGWQLYFSGSFDSALMETIVQKLETETGRTLVGRTFVDIGANIGTSTVQAIMKFGAARAIAFEPVPRNVDLLRLMVTANGLEDRVELRQLALSDVEGTAKMGLSPTNQADNRIRVGAGHLDQGDGRWGMIEVPMVPLDNVEIDFSQVSMVWMDVQGHEGHVLAGAKTLLSSGVPILTEYTPYMLKEANGLEMFHELVCDHFSQVVDCRRSDASALPIASIRSLAREYQAGYTDLLLLP